MDDFAIDLDKVLDDFEISEGTGNPSSTGSASSTATQSLPVYTTSPYTNTSTLANITPCQNTQAYFPYKPLDDVEIPEPNFAPASANSSYFSNQANKNENDENGGYFVPESSSPGRHSGDRFQDASTKSYSQIYNSNNQSPKSPSCDLSRVAYNANHVNYSTVMTNSMNALNLQAQMESRPELVQNAIMTMTLTDNDLDNGLSVNSKFTSSQPDVVPVVVTPCPSAKKLEAHVTNSAERNRDVVDNAVEIQQEPVSPENKYKQFLQGKHGPHIHAGPVLDLSEHDSKSCTEKASETAPVIEPKELSDQSFGSEPNKDPELGPALTSESKEQALSPENQATTASCQSSVDHAQPSFDKPDISNQAYDQEKNNPSLDNPEEEKTIAVSQLKASAINGSVSPMPHENLDEDKSTNQDPATNNPNNAEELVTDNALSYTNNESVTNTGVEHVSKYEDLSASSADIQHNESDAPEKHSVEFAEADQAEVTATEPEQPSLETTGPKLVAASQKQAPEAATDFQQPVVLVDSVEDDDSAVDADMLELEASMSDLPQAGPIEAVSLFDEICQQEKQEQEIIENIEGHSHRAGTVSPQSESSGCDELVPPVLSSPERRGSGGSVERFLIPNITSPLITTPMEESGMSKVPGYTPNPNTMSDITEEEAETADSLDSGSGEHVQVPVICPELTEEVACKPPSLEMTASGGVRPKELPATTQTQQSQRRSRPNSLLGLSTPDLGPGLSVQGGIVMVDNVAPNDTMIKTENTHDVINLQLAQQKSNEAMSPQRKNQLNMEIKQQQTGLINPEESVSPVITNRTQLAQGIGMNMPRDPSIRQPGPPTGRQAQPPRSLVGLTLPNNFPPPGHDTQASHTNTGPLPSYDPALQQLPQQRRPCSLNLPPRGDFQPAGVRRSPSLTPDIGGPGGAAGEDGSVASSESSIGAQTPVSPEQVAQAAAGASSAPMNVELPAPPTSANVNMPITHLGKFAPIWLPDAEAPNCMQCDARFTFTKRRHHCRACGKVFCSTCCNLRSRLGYLDGKEARVCSKCYQDLIRAQVYERMHPQPVGMSTATGQPSPNPNNPSEYCSKIPPLEQAQAYLNAPPPTVMVPTTGVLRKQGSQRRGEPKQVMFSDGIRPGGDLTELDGSSEVPAQLPYQRAGRKVKVVERPSSGDERQAAKTRGVKPPETNRNVCLIPGSGLPPVILQTGVKGDYSLEEKPDPEKIMPQIRNTEDPTPVVFAVNKNLFVIVKIINLDCCVNRVCWNFTTKGMCTVNQAEIVIVLECLPDEKEIPRDILTHLHSVYEEASKGNTVSSLGHTIFAQPFLDSRDHGGFLYMCPTFQCQQKLILPSQPYVYGVLLQKWETPWAKVFPIRLMLRLGAEFRYYPCPLISVRFRKPVYGEIGHTIMNLLADFRNYQYMLPSIKGITVHMEDKWTYINFPRNRYDQVMKVVNNSNEHVMALGANFSMAADSHLVCIQNEEGIYQTQAINIQNKPRKVTGASFVVFNGALKTSSGLRAKSSIVEDGLMVQITADSLAALKQALKDMQDYVISCGAVDAPQAEEHVKVQWVEEDRRVNVGVQSPIDGMSMEGIESIYIHNATDYAGDKRAIRWTECFFIKNDDQANSRFEPVDQSRLAETLAQSCGIALSKHLDALKEAGLTRIGLRATVDAEKVGYEVGANGEKLPDFCMNDLDTELIPVIHNAASHTQEGPVTLELIFHVVE